MTDLTPLFSQLLTTHSAPPLTARPPPAPRDPFLHDALTLLRALRTLHRTLAAAPAPAVTRSLRDINTRLTTLEHTERTRAAAQAAALHARFNTLRHILTGDPALRLREEARVGVENAHREAVLVGLKEVLRAVGAAVAAPADRTDTPPQRVDVMAVRRAAEAVVLEEEARRGEGGGEEEEGVLREMVQRGELQRYVETLEQVRSAESALTEISELQTQLAVELAVQNSHIETLVQDSMATEENLRRGNRELRKAAEKGSVARAVFLGAATFCGVVFVWDWFI